MKIHTSLITAAALWTFACAPAVTALAAESHQHAPAGPHKISLDHGKKWATDEPLRREMGAIRSTLAVQHAGIHKGTLTPNDYKALGSEIEARVARIVAECRLEPAADENLHVVVAELVAGADAMQGKSAARPVAGAEKVVRAVNLYGRYFDHPGWKGLR